MTNKTTKRALLASIVSLVLCFSMLLGTTFAWFTDSAVSGSNVITAGNLDIEVTYTLDGVTWNNLDGADDLFKKGLWEPGHTEVVVLKIENKGTLALKYSADINVVNEKVGKTKDGKDIVLSKILTVSTCTQQYTDSNGNIASGADIFPGMAFNQPEGWVGYQTTNTFENGKSIKQNKQLWPKESDYIAVEVDMAETVGNEANYKTAEAGEAADKYAPSITFGINVLATQYTYEKDSFGDQYDKDAEYPVYVPAGGAKDQIMGEDAAAILAALASGKDVIVDKNVDILGLTTDNIDAKGATATMNGVGPDAYGYLAFLPTNEGAVTVSNLKVNGSGFVEVGHYGNKGGPYVLNNVNIQNLAATLANGDKGFTLGCAFMAMGDVTLNNCVMTGTTAVQDGVMPVDLGCGQPWSGYTDGNDNKISTTINGGVYGTIYCWSKSVVTVDGAEVDTMYVAPSSGAVTIKAGTHVKTINVDYGTSTALDKAANIAKLVIEDGATVDTIVYKSTSYTVAEWNAYLATLN